jgi:hypothetical protein
LSRALQHGDENRCPDPGRDMSLARYRSGPGCRGLPADFVTARPSAHIHSLQIARIAHLSLARGSKIDGRRSERIGGGDFRERTRPGLTAIARFVGPEAFNECIQCFVSMRPPLRH